MKSKLILALGIISLLLNGCSFFSTPKRPSSEGTDHLSIISPHQKMIEAEWIPVFKAYHKQQTGKDLVVEWIDQGGTSDNLRFVESEFAKNPQTVNIDVFWGGGLTPFLKLSGAGWLQSYKVSDAVLSQIPQSHNGMNMYDHLSYRWYGTALSSFGILYNKTVMSKEKLRVPQTWEDLGLPAYENRIMGADPRHSGSAHTIYSIILQAYPWEKAWEVLTRMSANTREFIRSSSAVIKSVTNGDTAAGLSIDFYAWDAIAKYGEDKFGFVMPSGLTMINPDPVAILKGAPNLPVAQSFVEFLLRSENQKLWMLPQGDPEGPKLQTLGRLAIVPSLYDDLSHRTIIKINPFSQKGAFVYDDEKSEKMWAVVNDLIGTLLVDTNADLRSAWKTIIQKGLKPEAISALSKPPVSEQEALELTKSWDDALIRNKKINQWLNFAKTKYKKAANL